MQAIRTSPSRLPISSYESRAIGSSARHSASISAPLTWLQRPVAGTRLVACLVNALGQHPELSATDVERARRNLGDTIKRARSNVSCTISINCASARERPSLTARRRDPIFSCCLGWSNQLRQKEPTFYDGVEGELLLVLCKARHLRTGHQVMRPEQISTCGLGIPQQRWKRRKHLPQHKRSSVPLHRLRSSCRSRRRDHLVEGCTR